MAKKTETIHPRKIYCSGPDWKGDGSGISSTCPTKESMVTAALRFKCWKCCLPNLVKINESKN